MPTRDLLVILLGYLLGSVPFAHVVTRWRSHVNIREVGEGNVGSRNVWHVVGPGWGFLVGALDMAKGVGAVLLAQAAGASETAALLAGPATVAGHAFPVFLHFQGGKGVATTAGVVMAWMPVPTLMALALFGIAQLVLRDFNRSVVLGVVAAIFLPLAFGYPWTFSLYALTLFSSLALKKKLDQPHEHQVWAASGWEGQSRPGWYRETSVQDGSGGEMVEGWENGH